MAIIDLQARTITCKLVYYGPGIAGKYTNLNYLFHKTNPNARESLIESLVSRETNTERTVFFDFRLDLGELPGGFQTYLALHTHPG